VSGATPRLRLTPLAQRTLAEVTTVFGTVELVAVIDRRSPARDGGRSRRCDDERAAMSRAEIERLLDVLHWPWDTALSALLDSGLVLEESSAINKLRGRIDDGD
jgi:hypothetical protein